ncbi:hypothetical protein HN51_060724 [Arachis hypogaea]
MAFSSCQQNKYSPSTSTVISFFKIVLRQALQDDDFPPDGTEWIVEWINHDGGILFKNGWKEFVAYYSLDHRHLLWFEYNIGTSHMEVYIFANDQIKEQLPRRSQQPVKRPEEQKTRDVDSSPNTQNMRLNEGLLKKRLNEPLPREVQGQPRKKLRALVSSASKGKKNRRRKDSESPVRPCPIRPESLKEAKKFKPSSCDAFISSGWNFFARASKLQAGDICLFKLINRKDLVLDVHICRRQRRQSLFKPVTHGIQLFKEVKELNSQNPSFMVKIRESDPRKSRPNLPATFYRKYFRKNQQDVKLQFEKKSWPTTIIYNPTKKNTFISHQI